MNPQVLHLGQITIGLGLGLSVLGMGIGVGLIFSSVFQAIARQPELANRLTTLMWVGVALIEGVTLFSLVICFLNIK